MLVLQPREELLTNAGAEVQHDRRDVGGAGVDRGRDHVSELVRAVGDPRVGQRAHRFHPRFGMRSARFRLPPHLFVERADGERGRHRRDLGRLLKEIEIAEDQCPLREYREGVPMIDQGLHDAAGGAMWG